MFNRLFLKYYLDNTTLNPGVGGDVIATDDISGVKHELVKVEFGDPNSATQVSAANPLPVTDAVSETALAAIVAGQLTQAELAAELDEKFGDLGQANMAGSAPVVIASNQTAVPITGTVTVDTSLLATSAKQDTGNTSLSSIDTKLSSQLTQAQLTTELDEKFSDLGQAAMAASAPVVIASDQTAVPISAASLPLPTLAATSTKQSDGSQKTQIVDGSGNVIAATSNALNVNVSSGTVTITPSGTQDENLKQINAHTVIEGGINGTLAIGGNQATNNAVSTNVNPVLIAGSDYGGTPKIQSAKVDSVGKQYISTVDTVTAVTGITNALPSGTNVIGHVIADTGSTTAVTGNVTVVQSTGSNLHTVIDSGTVSISGAATDNTILFNTTLSATGAGAAIDTTGYQSIILQFTGTWVGNFWIEGSNDNTGSSIWQELLVMSIDEFSMQDVISENGSYQLKTSLKFVRINVLSLQSGSIVPLVLGRTSQGISAADILSFAMDLKNGSPLYTQETASKKDLSNALIPSDAPVPIYGSGATTNAIVFQVDTTGYQSVGIQCITLGSNVNIQSSNDGVTWSAVFGYNNTNNTSASTVAIVGMYDFPVLGRFMRGVMSGATFTNLLVYLRQKPVNTFNLAAGGAINIQSIAGTTPVNTGTLNSANSASTAAGTLVVGGSSAPGSTTVPNPIVIGGRELPSDAALAGKIRTILLDSLGRVFVTGQLSASSSSQNVASVPVQDTTQYEGQSQIEILYQILVEMRIQSQYMYELPMQLQKVFTTLNDSNNKLIYGFPTEPQEMRNDPTIFAN